MNRLQFLKRLLVTMFGAAAATSLRSEPTEGSSRPQDVTGEGGHPDPSSASGSASHTERSRGEQGRDDTAVDFDSGSAELGRSAQSTPKYLLSATVAGTAYYDFPEVGAQLLHTDSSIEPIDDDIDFLIPPSLPSFKEFPATLKLEPDNEFDYRAIQVYWSNHKMGYIPRRHNKVLYNLLKDGAELTVHIRLKPTVIPSEAEESILPTHDFQFDYDLRIRVYLLSENA